MYMINVEQTLTSRAPFLDKLPEFIQSSILALFRNLVHENDINEFIDEYKHLGSLEFIEKIFEYFNFDYQFSNSELENIPQQGRVVIIANHPLGALDALALIHLISKVRKDIKIVANEILSQIDQISDLLIPIDNIGEKYTKESISSIYESLESEQALIIFPSGEVSRARPTGIKDTSWKSGFLKFAIKTNAPILPIYIHAKNSKKFYTLSTINKNAAIILLPHEMFTQKDKTIKFTIGETIPLKHIQTNNIPLSTQVKLLKKHLYRISKNKKPIYATEKSIAHPEDRQRLKKELKESKQLGSTSDGKAIYLFDYQKDSSVMREIGRLREISFRKVDEGSGLKRDLDDYDLYYRHIVLWDDENLEIVGAYRIGESNFIFKNYDQEGFYSHSLFKFNEEFTPYLNNSIELGRSFVQPRYWGSRALDYLWQGIGAYLHQNQHIRYMFGPVSLSDAYVKSAKDMIITFYSHYFGHNEELVEAKDRYALSQYDLIDSMQYFDGDDYKKDLTILKERLSMMDLTIPTLYKQYADLCEEGGIKFLDFNIDRDFGNCVDSFILVDIDKIKESKRKRYIK
jgi:putative hemolysin